MEEHSDDNHLLPYRIAIPQRRLDDLHARLDATRWPGEMLCEGWKYGPPLDYLRELALYWRTEYDWRLHERRINSYPQFFTAIDGATVHFLHVRSARSDALPLIVTHGWPGSVVEFLDVIAPLTEDYHLVLPSIPGYTLSGPTRERGWDVQRTARAWAELMQRLGYRRYGAQGGDWGALISRELGRIDSEHVVGVHVNMLPTDPPSGEPTDPALFDEADRRRLAVRARYERELSGYAALQSTRPHTLAYALHDSPVGQLAWIADAFGMWTDNSGRPEDAVDRDALLTNVCLYWFTGTAASSARYYREYAAAARPPEPSPTPMGVATFPHDVVQPVRRWAEQQHRITHWSEFDSGGHFAAMEKPDLFVRDVRSFFHGLEAHGGTTT